MSPSQNNSKLSIYVIEITVTICMRLLQATNEEVYVTPVREC